MITVEFTKEEVDVLVRLLNAVTGLENARRILPLFDKIKAAAAK